MNEKYKVLFLDDERVLHNAFKRSLHGIDIEIETLTDPENALWQLKSKQFQIVVSDYSMPKMNGIEFLKYVREKSPDTIRVLISGKADLETVVTAINKIGLFRFVIKPWRSEDLRMVILDGCEHYRIKRENERLQILLENKNKELMKINAYLDQQVHERTQNFLLGLLNALDLRDTETQWHSRRVALYCRRLAMEIGIKGEELLNIERGGLLHDIGKIGIKDSILLKPGKLTQTEWEEIKRHPELGYNILKDIEFLSDARLIVLHHHERYDGSGYPYGLQGKEIHLGARIFAIIDTFDAITSTRPYRKAQPFEVAFKEISQLQGIQFDPKLVKAFLKIPQQDWQLIKERSNTKDPLFELNSRLKTN
jgi:response regulator RpfG family c-di-GMP phosphodiesterase